MERNFEISFREMQKEEGEWSDHPKDPGGATMKGVTLGSFRAYVKPGATKDDLRAITDEQLRTVYRRQYWNKILGAELPDGVDFALFDFAVNSGPKRAVQFIQRILGVEPDGVVGPKTLEAMRGKTKEFLINELAHERLEWLRTLKTWPTFGKGWSKRVKRVRETALMLAKSPTPENPSIIVEEKPVVPPKVEEEVKRKTDNVNIGVGVGGALVTLITTLLGAEWQAIVAVGGVAIALIVVLFILRKWLIAGIKEIKESL